MNRILLSLLVAGICFSCGENKAKGEDQQAHQEQSEQPEIVKTSDSKVRKTETRCPLENAWYEITAGAVTSMKDIEENNDNIQPINFDECSMLFFQDADGGGLFLALSSQGKTASTAFKLNAPLTRIDNGTYMTEGIEIKSKEKVGLMFDGDHTLSLLYVKKGNVMMYEVDMDSYKTLTDEMIDQMKGDLNK